MKKFFTALTLAVSFFCSTAIAQQPQQRPEQKAQCCQEKMDQTRPDHVHSQCPHQGEKGHSQCPHQGQQCAQQGHPQCPHQGEKGHPQCPHQGQQCAQQGHPQCPHQGEKGHSQCPHQGQQCAQQGHPQCPHQGQAGHQCPHQGAECQHDVFRPHGQAIVTLFEHLGATNSAEDGWMQNGFQMERAYLGYKYMFDPHWTATVIFDAAEATNTSIEHVFVKNAFVQYQKHGLTVAAGIIPTSHAWLSEKYWGLRYVGRSMFDLYGYGNVADLGFNVKYDISSWLSADVSMLNGEGYRSIQLDNHYLYALGFDIRPFEHFDIRIYGDIHTHDTTAVALADTTVNNVARKNLHIFAGYDHRYFRIGAEYNMRFASDYIKGDNATGLSVYAIGKVNPKLNIFCRYDRGVSSGDELLNSAFSYDRDGQNVFAGVDYHVNRIVSIAPAIQYHITPENATSLYAYLSCKVSL